MAGVLSKAINRIALPLFLKLDFTQAYAGATPQEARGWLVAWLMVDILVQFGIGRPVWYDFLYTLAGPVVCWRLKPILAAAIAGLYVGRAVISLAIAALGRTDIPPDFVAVAFTGWQLWILGCTLWLVLRYFQTPNRLMPAPRV